MKVFVVMGNDFPDAVFAKEADAEAYCESKRDGNATHGHRIYWRVYGFDLREQRQ